MRKVTGILTLIFSILLLESCESNKYGVMSTGSMEGTLKEGQLFRISPPEHISRNDIVVFKYTEDSKTENWVFRVAGLSGDKIEIVNGDLFVNNEFVAPPPKMKLSYTISTEIAESYGLTEEYEGYRISDSYCRLFLTSDEKDKILEEHGNIDFKRVMNEKGHHNSNLFLSDEHNRWNVDHYGPLMVPNENSEKLYFVLGDNRHNARDSRFIGFVKESDIIGIVSIDE